MSDKLKINLDSSSLRNAHCDMKFYNTVVKGYRPKLNSDNIEFGVAFHLGVKHYEDSGNIGEAMRMAYNYYIDKPMIKSEKGSHLTPIFLGKIIQDWYESDMHRNDAFETLVDINNNNKKCSEVKFSVPYYTGENCDIYLTGTIDKICVHKRSGLLAVGDYKTTSTWNQDEFLKDFKLSGQLHFYTLATKMFIDMADDSSILKQYADKDVGCFIDGVFLKGSKGVGEVTFRRSDVDIIKQDSLDQYDLMLQRFCYHLDKTILSMNYPDRTGLLNGTCITKGKCAFFDYCSHYSDTVAQEHILNRNFITKYYDPLNFNS